jgi:hypothetical protein
MEKKSLELPTVVLIAHDPPDGGEFTTKETLEDDVAPFASVTVTANS